MWIVKWRFMSIGKWNLMWYVVMRWSPCLSRYSYMVIGFEFKYGSACEWNDGRWEFRLYIDQEYLHYRFLFKWIVGLSADNLSSCLDEGNTHTLPTMSFLSFSFSFIKLLKKNKKQNFCHQFNMKFTREKNLLQYVHTCACDNIH